MKFRIKTNFFVKIAIFTFLMFCAITIVKMQFEFNTLKESKASLEQQLLQHNDRMEELNYQLNTPFDDAYIIKMAKEKLNYRMPGEILFYNDLAK